MTIEVFDLSPLPLFNADVQAAGWPAAVAEFQARIKAADALLIVSPEHNYSIFGVLKNAINCASRPPEQPFGGKPAAASRTMRARKANPWGVNRDRTYRRRMPSTSEETRTAGATRLTNKSGPEIPHNTKQ
ncbi:MAG: NADPH-dependent FMN reductase [bacterium]